MLVVHAEEKAIPSLFAGMGRKGNKMIAPRSKCVRGCRLIWHSLPPKEISQVLKAYKGCPYFALMSEQEYDGSAFEACPIVIQLYPKTSHKEAISPFLWYHIYNALVQCETPQDSFFLQIFGRSKVRLGFTSHDGSALHDIQYERNVHQNQTWQEKSPKIHCFGKMFWLCLLT